MRALAVTLFCIVAVGVARGSSTQDVTLLPRPDFPPPVRDVAQHGRLTLVASRFHSPADLPPARPEPPASAPRHFRGAELQLAVRQVPGRLFLVYGGRYLVQARPRSLALDFLRFMRPPNGAWLEEVTWAREVGGILYVEHTHLTYATATKGRNAYLSAIDLAKGKTLWRSPALVANARTFVVTGDLVVSGYGFTAESDYLYALDRRTGRVLDRLAVPSAPELIRLRGDRLHVRTYDHDLVVRLRR